MTTIIFKKMIFFFSSSLQSEVIQTAMKEQKSNIEEMFTTFFFLSVHIYNYRLLLMLYKLLAI